MYIDMYRYIYIYREVAEVQGGRERERVTC